MKYYHYAADESRYEHYKAIDENNIITIEYIKYDDSEYPENNNWERVYTAAGKTYKPLLGDVEITESEFKSKIFLAML
jgi:hypothetical protein